MINIYLWYGCFVGKCKIQDFSIFSKITTFIWGTGVSKIYTTFLKSLILFGSDYSIKFKTIRVGW